MKHNNIAVFIPHIGCKNCCSFCNQNVISGADEAPSPQEVFDVLQTAFDDISDKGNTEIAFFGGSFTAIDRGYMTALLETASSFIGEGKFSGIRVSTRPDCIDIDTLDILKRYGVTTIELGAQSMCDEVLSANNRGHTANDVRTAAGLIKERGFSLGLQMMVGLYKSSPQCDELTAKELVRLKPSQVRIYPTVVLENTALARLYKSGEYTVMPLENVVELCARLLLLFEENNISVIKLGLHSSTDVERDMIGGIYHPAFRELCESEIYFNKAKSAIENLLCHEVLLFVNEKAVSKMIGQRKTNVEKFKNMGYNITVLPKYGLSKYEIVAKEAIVCS